MSMSHCIKPTRVYRRWHADRDQKWFSTVDDDQPETTNANSFHRLLGIISYVYTNYQTASTKHAEHLN